MKLLIIDDGIFSTGLALVLNQSIECDIIMSSHKDALETFLLEEPTHILVCESWGETADGKTAEFGGITFEDINNSAGAEVTIRRVGFDKENDLVYLFEIEDVLASLQI